MESASASSGTTRTRMSGRCSKGNMIDEKSPCASSTSAPAGTAAATIEVSAEVWEPIATRESGTPTSEAYEARVLAMTGS